MPWTMLPRGSCNNLHFSHKFPGLEFEYILKVCYTARQKGIFGPTVDDLDDLNHLSVDDISARRA